MFFIAHPTVIPAKGKQLSHWFNCWSHTSTFSSCTLGMLFYSYLWGKVLFFYLMYGFLNKFIYLYVHPYLGKIPILTNIFQMGWNHQLVYIYIYTHILCYYIIPRAPLWPLFLKVNTSKQGLNSNQNKGPHLGSRCVNSMNSTLCWTTFLQRYGVQQLLIVTVYIYIYYSMDDWNILYPWS